MVNGEWSIVNSTSLLNGLIIQACLIDHSPLAIDNKKAGVKNPAFDELKSKGRYAKGELGQLFCFL
jgi:hypothetical protein